MQKLLSLCMLLVWVSYIIFDAYSFSFVQVPTVHAAPTTHTVLETSPSAQESPKTTPTQLAPSSQNTFLLEDARVLSEAYEKTQDPVIGKNLVLKLVDLYQFDRALTYIESMRAAGIDTIEPTTYLYVLINSSRVSPTQSQSMDIVQNALSAYVAQGKLDANQQLFYGALIKLWNNDFYGAKILFDKITGDTYAPIVSSMHDVYAKATTMQDMPLYYWTALFALQLLKNGYFSIASKLALEVLNKDPSYTLPYQILAYKHFLTQSWEPALQYLLQLRDLDPKNEATYVFMIGVSSYWLDKYEQAALYLKQVEYPAYTLDAQRYLALSYIAMDNTQDTINTRQAMLWNPSIQEEDFYNYFGEVFYKPYTQKKLYTLYNANTNLGFLYIKTCFDILGEKNADVCNYGNAWLHLAKWEYAQAQTILSNLAQTYQESYIYQALWNITLSQGDQATATDYFSRAISVAWDSGSENIIEQQILEAN